jgi:hypothetical protein
MTGISVDGDAIAGSTRSLRIELGRTLTELLDQERKAISQSPGALTKIAQKYE